MKQQTGLKCMRGKREMQIDRRREGERERDRDKQRESVTERGGR
jgi:hypothetical protein